MKGIGVAQVLDLIGAFVFLASKVNALHLLGFGQLKIASELVSFDDCAVG